jgi:hypothetical protein
VYQPAQIPPILIFRIGSALFSPANGMGLFFDVAKEDARGMP